MNFYKSITAEKSGFSRDFDCFSLKTDMKYFLWYCYLPKFVETESGSPQTSEVVNFEIIVNDQPLSIITKSLHLRCFGGYG